MARSRSEVDDCTFIVYMYTSYVCFVLQSKILSVQTKKRRTNNTTQHCARTESYRKSHLVYELYALTDVKQNVVFDYRVPVYLLAGGLHEGDDHIGTSNCATCVVGATFIHSRKRNCSHSLWTVSLRSGARRNSRYFRHKLQQKHRQ